MIITYHGQQRLFSRNICIEAVKKCAIFGAVVDSPRYGTLKKRFKTTDGPLYVLIDTTDNTLITAYYEYGSKGDK